MIAFVMQDDKIFSQKHIVAVFFIALLLFIVSQVYFILLPFSEPILWAAIMAFGFYPLYLKIKQFVGGREIPATIITTSIIFLIFVPLAGFLVARLAEEAAHFYHWLTRWVHEGNLRLWAKHFLSLGPIQKIKEQLFEIPLVRQNMKGWITSQASNLVQIAARQSGMMARDIALFFFYSFMTFFLVFFFLKDGARIYRFIYVLTPLEEKTKKELFESLTETLGAALRGQILTSLAQAVIAGLVFWALGLPVPIFFTVLTFFATMIPVFGAAAVWFPFVIYLFATGHTARAVILLGLGVFVISLVDNFLKPLIIGEKTDLPFFLLFLGILGGLEVYGLIGIFLAPIVLSIFFVLIKVYREQFLA